MATPEQVTADLRQAMVGCWLEVTNAGGAAGFPFPPVTLADVTPVLDAIIQDLDPDRSRLLTAHHHGRFAGWVNIRHDGGRLTGHWGTVHHLQTRTSMRGQGIGAGLMNEVRRIARDELTLEQLHLAARGGVGLETFYGQLGWTEVGRWPDALRVADGEDHDEVLMLLAPL
ncbi:N-acetyltransferase family protein [Promicromonospora sp. Marseille-Q5078]